MKLEFYSTDQVSVEGWIDDRFGPYINEVTGDWQPYRFRVKVSEGTVATYVYLRLWGAGSVDYDDALVSLVPIGIHTDQLIYYDDAASGSVIMETRFDGVYTGKTVERQRCDR